MTAPDPRPPTADPPQAPAALVEYAVVTGLLALAVVATVVAAVGWAGTQFPLLRSLIGA